ncbi:hypothetical protein [Mahella sp.]|uniref:hypothetical protein n=1 Tax=Mahella sp. TaxID=2798721 RepID=UPI0025C6F9EB|nr:hypothetical protein [Mahella sp.]MBZ4666108.1 hypothetical protein [Mahella sp.]
MDGIFEQIAQTDIIGLLVTIIVIITEFIFLIPINTLLIRSKTPFIKEQAKQYTLLVLFVIIFFGIIISAILLNKSISWFMMVQILIPGGITIVSYECMNSLRKKLYSPNKYYSKPSKTRLSILIVVAMLFFSAVCILTDIVYAFSQINNIKSNMSFATLENIIAPLIFALLTYIYTIFACSYILTFGSLNNLPKCIIKVRDFKSSKDEYKDIDCYVISEDDDEIMIKPDQSRVISIRKELIIEREYIDDYNGSTKKDGVRLFKWLKKFMGKQVNSPS